MTRLNINVSDALERMGMVISVLKDGYEKATFFVEDEFEKSEKKTVLWDKAGVPTITLSICDSNDMHRKRHSYGCLE